MTNEKMLKIILLPGMDGTGKLFEDFLSNLDDVECEIISFPQSGAQDYDSLAAHVKDRLPTQDFVLLAESFAGPIAAKLALEEVDNLRGVIFVASFLSPPNKLALSLARVLPIKTLLKLPFSEFGIRRLMLGSEVSKSLVASFKKVVMSVPDVVLKARLCAMQNLVLPSSRSQMLVFYLSGSEDRLVPMSKLSEFGTCFPVLKHWQVEGPHFLLQANPKGCSSSVLEMLSLIITDRGGCQNMTHVGKRQ